MPSLAKVKDIHDGGASKAFLDSMQFKESSIVETYVHNAREGNAMFYHEPGSNYCFFKLLNTSDGNQIMVFKRSNPDSAWDFNDVLEDKMAYRNAHEKMKEEYTGAEKAPEINPFPANVEIADVQKINADVKIDEEFSQMKHVDGFDRIEAKIREGKLAYFRSEDPSTNSVTITFYDLESGKYRIRYDESGNGAHRWINNPENNNHYHDHIKGLHEKYETAKTNLLPTVPAYSQAKFEKRGSNEIVLTHDALGRDIKEDIRHAHKQELDLWGGKWIVTEKDRQQVITNKENGDTLVEDGSVVDTIHVTSECAVYRVASRDGGMKFEIYLGKDTKLEIEGETQFELVNPRMEEVPTLLCLRNKKGEYHFVTLTPSGAVTTMNSFTPIFGSKKVDRVPGASTKDGFFYSYKIKNFMDGRMSARIVHTADGEFSHMEYWGPDQNDYENVTDIEQVERIINGKEKPQQA